ncbi:MAG: MauE/DoxX family redox-associated membrane protein [bacterium]
MPLSQNSSTGWAVFFARWILGLLFFMAGWFKVFELGALQHAQKFFVEGYRQNWIPLWLLWTTGVSIPFAEFISGALLILGFRIKEALLTVGAILVIVTYGHLLKEPLFDITTHIFPRAVFLVILLALPRDSDAWSLDAILRRRRARTKSRNKSLE